MKRIQQIAVATGIAALAAGAAASGVEASGFDADGDQVALTWGATVGFFDDPLAAATFYRCAAPGSHVLKLTYEDGRRAKVETSEVTCLP